ncbi:MAG: cytochrome c family protein [Hyphomicrobium sp.]|nr:cytochrome c family protein [Hyphomicrobium sp.]
MRKLVLAVTMIAAMPAAAYAADAEAGKAVFGKCKACHQTGPGAKNAVGPHLDGVVGRAAGAAEGFKYSDALKNSGITWDEANLKEWLADPKKKVPGNKMVFMGLKDEADIDNLIAYLKTNGQ